MKNIKNTCLIFMLTVASVSMYAQQDPNFTLYRYNMNVINPAYAGTNDQYEINLLFRKQWAGVDDAPITTGASFAAPLGDKVGLGLTVIHDEVFVLKETDVTIDFSYKVQLSDSDMLYLGLKAGGSFLSIDLLSLNQPNDPLLTQNESRFNPTIGAGAYFKGDKYYVSLSTTNVLNGKRFEQKGTIIQNGRDRVHLYATAGYKLGVSENVSITPGLFARFVAGAPTTTEIFAVADFYEKVETTVAYRVDESIAFSALFKLVRGLDFGYAYEHTTTDVENISDGTHEFIVRIKFD